MLARRDARYGIASWQINAPVNFPFARLIRRTSSSAHPRVNVRYGRSSPSAPPPSRIFTYFNYRARAHERFIATACFSLAGSSAARSPPTGRTSEHRCRPLDRHASFTPLAYDCWRVVDRASFNQQSGEEASRKIRREFLQPLASRPRPTVTRQLFATRRVNSRGKRRLVWSNRG